MPTSKALPAMTTSPIFFLLLPIALYAFLHEICIWFLCSVTILFAGCYQIWRYLGCMLLLLPNNNAPVLIVLNSRCSMLDLFESNGKFKLSSSLSGRDFVYMMFGFGRMELNMICSIRDGWKLLYLYIWVSKSVQEIQLQDYIQKAQPKLRILYDNNHKKRIL